MPSLIKILEDRFECYSTAPRYKFRDNGNKYEIDIIGHATDAYYLVEIKSHLRGEAIEQLHKLIVNFKEHDKFYRGEKIYGVIVATDYSEDLYNTALSEGFFFISTSSNIAELKIPLGFEPVVF